MVRPFGLIEMVRTGEIAVARGRERDLGSRRRRAAFAPLRTRRPFELDERAERGAARARRRARAGGPGATAGAGIASLTVPVPAELDLSAAVLAARRPDDRFFCFEQPDRDGFALAGARGGGRARGLAGPAASRRWPTRRASSAGATWRTTPRVTRARRPAPGRSSSAASRSRTTAARRPSGRRSRRRRSCCPSWRSPASDGEARMTVCRGGRPRRRPARRSSSGCSAGSAELAPGVDAAARSRSGRAHPRGERGAAVALRARRRARGRAHPRG